MLDEAAKCERERRSAACTDIAPVPKLRVQVAGALLRGVAGLRCEVIDGRRKNVAESTPGRKTPVYAGSDTGAGAPDLRVLAGVQADAVLRTRQRRQLP
jgi:hypothetical protein